MLERKKEMLRELSTTAWSLVNDYYSDTSINEETAKKLAIRKIEKMRYGTEQKDYFWITDTQPVMIMHPYRPDLNGSLLKDYKDPTGKKLFVESVKIVREKNEGILEYLWQWMDDSTRIVPKISYVKGFKPWGWIIGTGIYVEDIRNDIRILKSGIIRTSAIIALLLSVIFIFLIRQSSLIEKRRQLAEKKLKLSREKYMTLVEASTEGAVLLMDGKVIFSNHVFNKMINKNPLEVLSLGFNDIFETEWTALEKQLDEPGKSVTLETRLKNITSSENEILISVSKIKYGGKDGHIVSVKNISGQHKFEKEIQLLNQDLQSALVLMNQPVKDFIHEFARCDIHTSVGEAAKLMTEKNQDCILVFDNNSAVGILTDSDLRQRVVLENKDTSAPVINFLSAPLMMVDENINLFEANYLLKQKAISHLIVKDAAGKIKGILGKDDILEIQRNTLSYILKEINTASDIGHLRMIFNRIPVLTEALLQSGAQINIITRTISSISDEISRKVISLAIDKAGHPPCRFSFIVMGSVGRMEQTLSTDQDNAIIFEDSESNEYNQEYFVELGKAISSNLNKIGYRFCKGNVMVMNPVWIQPLSVWKNYFRKWINTADPQDLLDAFIFFDFKNIYGEEKLSSELQNDLFNELQDKSIFFLHLALTVIKMKIPGIASSLSSAHDAAPVDIKKILLPITGFIRLMALKENIRATNSFIRLEQLLSKNIIPRQMYDEILFSLNFLMSIRLKSQTRAIFRNEAPTNLIDFHDLNDIEIATLRKVILKINEIQDFLSLKFKTAGLDL